MVSTTEQATTPLWLSIIRLLRWHKPEGRLILMIPELWAVFFAAAGKPPVPLVGTIILGTLATSAAGGEVNDLWDKDIDPEVERTRNRPIASRALSIKVGIIVAFLSLGCAAILSLYLNLFSFILSVAAVPVILLYPGAKRVFPVPQLVLSIAWGFAVLISWSAVTGDISSSTWLLWGATVFWTLGFDTVYAMSDREDDKRIGVNSSALFFGKYAPEAIGFFYVVTTALLFALGAIASIHPFFWITLSFAAAGWMWQYFNLKKSDLPNSDYGQMFRQNVWIGFILLAGMIIGRLW